MSEPYRVRGRGGGVESSSVYVGPFICFDMEEKACNFATFPEIYVGAI